MRPYHLFVTQCLDRIERGGLPRGIKAEENSDRCTEKKCQHDRPGRNQRRPMFDRRKNFRATMPRIMPSNPPTELSETASIRNWVRISRPCAPTAIRVPISRVRSVTLTSMIFIIPMPPTTSDTPAIAPSNPAMTSAVAVAASAISC